MCAGGEHVRTSKNQDMEKTTEMAAMAMTAATAATVAEVPAAAGSTTVYVDPLLDPALYPSFHEFMTAGTSRSGKTRKKEGEIPW